MTVALYLINALRAGETVRFVARGTSMWPSIRDGALVEVVPCKAGELHTGDVAAFERKGQVVVHRVLATSGASLRFAGDGRRKADGMVDSDRVLGRARVLRQPALHARWPSRRHAQVAARLAVRAAAITYVRGDAWRRRMEEASRAVVAGLLSDALTRDEQRRLGVLFYDVSFRAEANPGALWHWERDWFSRRLPPPPGHLLVGGAGAGREAASLCASGYTVDALEPAPRPAQSCQAVVGSKGEVVIACYEDLSRAVLDGMDGPAAPLAHRRYDAVVLGWGSLTHVLEPDERLRLLQACCRLAPAGPILASFWLKPEETSRGRAHAIGRAAGRLIGRLRGLPSAGNGVSFGAWFGFAHTFSGAEIEALAAGLGRGLIWEAERGYPHVTFAAPGP